MKTITMTTAETAAYDSQTAQAHETMQALRARAQEMADAERCTVEVETEDGIVALVAEPEIDRDGQWQD
jgi:hypothetical protein